MPTPDVLEQRRQVRNRTTNQGGPGGPMPVGGLISDTVAPGPMPGPGIPPAPMPVVPPGSTDRDPRQAQPPIRQPPVIAPDPTVRQPTDRLPLPPAFTDRTPMNQLPWGGGPPRQPGGWGGYNPNPPRMEGPPLGGGGIGNMAQAVGGMFGGGVRQAPAVRQKPMQERNIMRNVGGRVGLGGLGPY